MGLPGPACLPGCFEDRCMGRWRICCLDTGSVDHPMTRNTGRFRVTALQPVFQDFAHDTRTPVHSRPGTEEGEHPGSARNHAFLSCHLPVKSSLQRWPAAAGAVKPRTVPRLGDARGLDSDRRAELGNQGIAVCKGRHQVGNRDGQVFTIVDGSCLPALSAACHRSFSREYRKLWRAIQVAIRVSA